MTRFSEVWFLDLDSGLKHGGFLVINNPVRFWVLIRIPYWTPPSAGLPDTGDHTGPRTLEGSCLLYSLDHLVALWVSLLDQICLRPDHGQSAESTQTGLLETGPHVGTGSEVDLCVSVSVFSCWM